MSAEHSETAKPCRWWNRWLCLAYVFNGVPLYHSWRCNVCGRIIND